MINDTELDKLTEVALEGLINHIGAIRPDASYKERFTGIIQAQEMLKDLYRKGYNAGVGETILKDKKNG